MRKLFMVSFLGVFSALTHAGLVMPGDGPYSRWRDERILYVYDNNAHDVVTQISAYMLTIRKLYDASFAWNLDETEDLVLTSPHQQVANAFATVVPNIKSVWFPSGSGMLEEMAQSSWFLTLATHETAHLYQLNAKGKFNSALKSVFGNATEISPFILPIFIHPNLFTPLFLVEGNAVLNESRANLGGRLHSGEARALVLAQIQAGQINPARLINREFRFPYGENVYLQGGYFQAHLAAKYGVDKTNQFFLAQGDHFLWPLILNKTFRDHFGASYPQEIHEYVREMEGLAKNQKATTGRLVTQAKYFSPLNQDAKEIFYLSSDGIEPPRLNFVKKADATVFTREADLPLGKVFWDKDAPLAVSSEQHDLHNIEYSLYGEGYVFEPRYRGQIVNDQRAGKTVALDAANSWLEPKVLLNGETYDVGHSNPILDEEGSVYYFRQNGAERVLYKNRAPVFKYDGFYGKLTEVAADGTIYFIANTDYGSTLYQYRNQEISRVLDSDRVVDARALDANRFLAVEVYADGHRAYVTEAQLRPARPVVYSYGFPSYNLLPQKLTDTEQFKTEERSYNSFREIRYSATDFNSSFDDANGLSLYLNSQFVDPLQYQAFNIGVAGTGESSQNFFAGYTFTKYLPQLSLGYLYQKEIWHQHNSAAITAYNQQFSGGMMLPLLRWQHWDASWNLSPYYKYNENHLDPTAVTPQTNLTDRDDAYGALNSITLSYSKSSSPDLALYSWRQFVLNYQNKLDVDPYTGHRKNNTSLIQSSYQHGFPWEMYGTLSGNFAWGETHDVLVGYNPQPLTFDIRIPRIVAHNEYTAQTAGTARFEFAKVLNFSAYSTRIPVSIERLAPFVIAQGMFLDSSGAGYGDYPPSIFEWGFGFDIQLLYLHSDAIKMRFVNAYDTRNPVHRDDSSQILQIQGRF